jgi:hypothetical protein
METDNERKSNKSNSPTRALSREAERKEAKEKFLAFLREDPTVSLACEHIDRDRTTVYDWREKDQKFAQEWDNALERARDVGRSSIYKRGIIGWEEPMVSMGQVVYETEPVLDEEGEQKHDSRGRPMTKRGAKVMVPKNSDSLALAWAKANLPEYKDKPQVNIHAQLEDLAQKAKDELLADLAAAIDNEDKEPSNQS